MALVNLWIIDEMRTHGNTPYTETITKGHILPNNKGEIIIFQLTKGRYDEALMIGSHHRRERDRGMQLSLVLLGKDYTNTNTQRSSTYHLLLKHKYRTQVLV